MSRAYSVLHALIRRYCGPAVVATAASLLVGNAAAEKPPDEVFAVTTAITLPSPQKITSFDISFVDPVIGEYFLADRTNQAVDVVDTGTNTLVTQLKATPPFAGATGNNDTSGPDGVITVGHKEVWAGDG